MEPGSINVVLTQSSFEPHIVDYDDEVELVLKQTACQIAKGNTEGGLT